MPFNEFCEQITSKLFGTTYYLPGHWVQGIHWLTGTYVA